MLCSGGEHLVFVDNTGTESLSITMQRGSVRKDLRVFAQGKVVLRPGCSIFLCNFRMFESVVHYLSSGLDAQIPLTFMLGFFVTFVVSRWTAVLAGIGWIDK